MIGDIFASVRSTHDYALLCDGSAIPTTAPIDEYAALKALIGNYTPDLRDKFLRGNRNGRDLLSYEADGNKSHSHTLQFVSWNSAYGDTEYNYRSTASYLNKNHNTVKSRVTAGDYEIKVDGNSEVTVKNISVNFFYSL